MISPGDSSSRSNNAKTQLIAEGGDRRQDEDNERKREKEKKRREEEGYHRSFGPAGFAVANGSRYRYTVSMHIIFESYFKKKIM